MKQKKSQAGVALVTALLIVALTTIMAVSLASRQYMDVRRTGNIMLSDQAYLNTLALESFASQLLKAYRGNQKQKYDNQEDFDKVQLLFQMIPVDNGSVSASVEFPEARFNVNTLIDKDGKVKPWERDYYDRLLGLVMQELGMDFSLKQELVGALVDWIDPNDQEDDAGGAEDSTYESHPIPYKAANRMMGSISELRLVEGYTKELLDGFPGDKDSPPIPGLLAYLTALPDRDSTLNINLISWEAPPVGSEIAQDALPPPGSEFALGKPPKLFLAMMSKMDTQMVEDLMNARPFEGVNQFMSHSTFDQLRNDPNEKDQLAALAAHIDVQSSYFLLRGSGTVGDSKIILNSLIYTDTSGTKVEVVSRAIGTPGI